MFSAASVGLFVSVCVCQFVSVFVGTITSQRLNVGRSNLAFRYNAQTLRPSSKVKVQRSKVKVTGDKKTKN